MMKLVHFLMLVAILGIFAFGCGEQPNPIEFEEVNAPGMTAIGKVAIPTGAVLESATFYIYITQAANHNVDVHRVTSAWDENVVTWNNFGGAYNAGVEASFTSDAVGWKTVDLTPLFQDWLDGTYDNFGFLLAQDDNTSPRTIYYSTDNTTNNPYLTLCYNLNGQVTCVDDDPIGDTYIWQISPDMNYGGRTALYTGWQNATDLEKQSLIQFETDMIREFAEIGDTVWFDDNRDGIQDGNESGFQDVTVELYFCEGDEYYGSTTTDAEGFYIFTGLIPGDYYVKFIRPEGYVFTLQNIGDDDNDSDVDPATGLDVCTNLEGGESDMTHDAGLYLRDMEGCSLTIGFWKTHAGFGPQENVLSQYLDIWLGTANGGKSLLVNSAAIAVDILKMKTYGLPKNGITKLYAQLLGAKLNMAAGADVSVIADAMAEADAFLAENDWEDWNKRDKTALNLMSIFDDYNNGDIGPGHCDDFGDDD